MAEPKPEMIVCGWCKTKFERLSPHGRRPRFCSDTCRAKAHRRQVDKSKNDEIKRLKAELKKARRAQDTAPLFSHAEVSDLAETLTRLAHTIESGKPVPAAQRDLVTAACTLAAAGKPHKVKRLLGVA